jgi:hypothetical protein
MSLRRISTRSFGLTAAAQLENGRKLAEALSLPMFADILETMDHHDGARFFIVAPVQVGKSAIGQCRLARNHYIRPRPAGWYGPTDDFIKDFVDTKLNPLLAAHPDIALITPTEKYKVAKLRAAYVAGSHLMLSAATENDRTGKTFCDIYLDEPHLYGPGWIEQISNRRRDLLLGIRIHPTYFIRVMEWWVRIPRATIRIIKKGKEERGKMALFSVFVEFSEIQKRENEILRSNRLD